MFWKPLGGILIPNHCSWKYARWITDSFGGKQKPRTLALSETGLKRRLPPSYDSKSTPCAMSRWNYVCLWPDDPSFGLLKWLLTYRDRWVRLVRSIYNHRKYWYRRWDLIHPSHVDRTFGWASNIKYPWGQYCKLLRGNDGRPENGSELRKKEFNHSRLYSLTWQKCVCAQWIRAERAVYTLHWYLLQCSFSVLSCKRR